MKCSQSGLPRRLCTSRAVAVLVSSFAALPLEKLPAEPADLSGWLNVKDLGASGSKFETTATTTAGSSQVVVANAGDFRVGQGVMVSKCNPRLTDDHLWGPGSQYVAGSGKPLKDIVDLRGYDETAGSWTVFLLDVEPANPPSCGWDLVWTSGGKPIATSVIESFDPETLRFRLKEPRDITVGDTYEVFPPYGVRSIAEDNWLAWAPTGAEIYRVDDAGELHLER